MNDIFSIENKITLITGGATALGFGIAKRFVTSGAMVFLTDVDAKGVRDAAMRLDPTHKSVAALGVEIMDDAGPERIISSCIARFGAIDVLINNAGDFPIAPLQQMAKPLFDRAMRINLHTLVLLSRAAAVRMAREGRGGKIINIGHPASTGLAAYDASRNALMVTRSFALETAMHNVHVNAILPGGIATDGAPDANTFIPAKKTPLGRIGVPDDIATVAQFLASAASDYMTGAHIVVDGGSWLPEHYDQTTSETARFSRSTMASIAAGSLA